jgi:hypothetical protein
LTALVDPAISIKELISLREIARCLHAGMLTENEAATAVVRISPKFAGVFTDMATAAAVIEMIDALLQARSPAATRLSRSERYRLKAAESLQLAGNAAHARPREIYKDLAFCYEQLACQAEAIEKHRYRQLARRTGVKR